jgi:hypothetical protein
MPKRKHPRPDKPNKDDGRGFGDKGKNEPTPPQQPEDTVTTPIDTVTASIKSKLGAGWLRVSKGDMRPEDYLNLCKFTVACGITAVFVTIVIIRMLNRLPI